jgi:DNA-binding transcriptional ArsR family regulator
MDMFTALAEPNRRNIIELLATQGELSASAIAERFQISSAAISQHLKVLKESKLVFMHKQAQQRIYEINPDAVKELEKWAQQMTENYERLNELLHTTKETNGGKI